MDRRARKKNDAPVLLIAGCGDRRSSRRKGEAFYGLHDSGVAEGRVE